MNIYTPAVRRYLTRHGYDKADPRGALIDMDGTLYDSMPLHAAAWQQMMREVGVDVPLDEFFRYEGRTGASTIDVLFHNAFGHGATEEEKTSLYGRKAELFAAMPPVDIMPGSLRVMDFLKRVGMERVLVTGSGQNTLLNRLDADFPGVFAADRKITSRDVKHGKPLPEPYEKAMSIAGLKPWQCVVIENAPLGVESGYASGAFTIGVTTGPLKECELTEAGADIVMCSMNALADAFPLLYEALVTTEACL